MRQQPPSSVAAWETLPELATVLTESVDAVKQREATALDDLLRANVGRVVLFGAGTLGRKAITLLRELGVEPLALCDSNPSRWGELVAGLTVISPESAAKNFGRDSLFLVTIWNDFHWFKATEAKLKALGCSINSFAPLFWRFGGRFMDLQLLNEPPHRLYEQRDPVLAAEHLWADDESLSTYRANILWRALGDPSRLPYPALRNTYFPADILALRPDEAIVDCGAFDGDTIRMTLNTLQERFAALYAIEADATSLTKLAAYLATLHAELQQKIVTMQCAVGETRGTLRFSGDGSLTSKPSADGREVPCLPLDEIFATTPVSFIKMDIEGAEHGALLGARNLIARDRPVLAVCVYHTQNDIWRIPLLVQSMAPGYALYLRSYDGDGFQTVLYAVPEERRLAAPQRGIAPRKPDERPPANAPANHLSARLKQLFPAGQIIRYLCVGAFNTVFGYLSYAAMLTLLNGHLPQRFLYLTVVLASAIVTPVNITVAFLGYKFFVFRTRGHFLKEWAKCFAVYGAGWLPGLFALSATTKALQLLLHRYNPPLHWLNHASNANAAAGYIAGLLMVFVTTIYSFLGHKHITFRRGS